MTPGPPDGLPGVGGQDGFGGFGRSFLTDAVGRGRRNKPEDVFQTSSFLAANGHLPAPTRDADEGFLRGIERGQKRLNGLAGGGLFVDGIAKPWGPTEILSQRAVTAGRMKPPADATGREGDATARLIVNTANDRIDAIITNKPAIFEIRDNPKADAGDPWYASPSVGKTSVLNYGKLLNKESEKQGVDPDLPKAIVFAENARGHYFGLAKTAEGFGAAKTILPMNINPRTWTGLGIDALSAHDPATNIRAGVTLIKRISDRIVNPTAAKIASVWNFAGRENVNDFGAYVGRIYREKPRAK